MMTQSPTGAPPSAAPSSCCCWKSTRTWCGVVSMIIGILFLIGGGSIGNTITRAAQKVLQETVTISGALEVPIVAARIAADVYGGPPGSLPFGITTAAGTSSDDDDNGLANDIYVPSITNVAAILAGGGASPPAPVVTEIGPLAYRSYSTIEQNCLTCGVSNGVETWYDRKWVRYDAARSATGFADHRFGGPFDTTYVTVPNTNYRGLEAQLSAVTQGVVTTFETLAVPLLGLQGVQQLMAPAALDVGTRTLVFPLALGALLQTALGSGLITDNFIDNTPAAISAGFAVSIGGSLYADSLALGVPPMSHTVPAALFTPGSAAAGAVSPLSAVGWTLTVPALTDCPAAAKGVPLAGAACNAYSTALQTAAGDYPAGDAGAKMLQRDVGVILAYFGALLSVAPCAAVAPTAAQAKFEAFAVGALMNLQTQLGCSGAACDIHSWNDALWAQMANNGVTGLIMSAGVFQSAGGAAAAAAYPSLAGTGAGNLCSASALSTSAFLSLADKLPVPGGAVPEFSCWNARANPASFGSKVSGAALKAVFGSPADPAGASPPVATSLLGGGLFRILNNAVPGTGGVSNTLMFLAGAATIANNVKAELATGTAGPFHAEVLVFTAFAALKAAPSATTTAAYAAAVAGATAAPCPANKGNLLLLPLRCFELVDLAAWLSHIAKDVVFDPTFVKAGPRMWNATAVSQGACAPSGAFVPLADPYYASRNLFSEATPLRAGPFLRCTLREYVELGCHDNLMDYVMSLLSGAAPGSYKSRMSPAGLTTYEGSSNDQAWATYKNTNQPNQRFTGATDISQVDVITAYSVNNVQAAQISAFGGPAGSPSVQTNPVTGSYSGNHFAPTLKIAGAGPQAQDYSATWPSISVWVYQGLRACSLAFSSQVTDPAGAGIRLWRFMLNTGSASGVEPSAAQWAAAIPRMKTDDAATPSCAANVAPLLSGVKVYLAPPYFHGCAANGLGAGVPVPGYTLTPGSPAATRDPNSPTAGTVTFVDVEPMSGLTMNAHKRLGAHMYWGGATAWFNLKPTYGLLYWFDQYGQISSGSANTFVTSLGKVKQATSTGVGVLIGIGVVLLLVGAVSTFFGCRMPRAVPGGGAEEPPPQEVYAVGVDKLAAVENPMSNAPASSVVFRAVAPVSGEASAPPQTAPPQMAPPPPPPPAMPVMSAGVTVV